MSRIVFFFFFLQFSILNAQNSEAIFLSYLYQEGILNIKTIDNAKSNFSDLELINIELDTINDILIFNNNYSLLKFQLGKNKIEIESEKKEIIFHSSSCETYVILINNESNASFRLKGFNGNDLLFLIKDIKNNLYRKKKDKQILKELQFYIEDIDFFCIYKSIIKMKLKSDCLKACNEPIFFH